MNIFLPKERADSIDQINFSSLKKQGFKNIILDIDDTLLPRKTKEISSQLKAWIADRKKVFNIVLVSNSWHFNRVKGIGEVLGIPSKALAGKPFPWAYTSALKKIGGKAAETVVVGDQLFMDILGGNLLGMHTILVKNILPETFWLRKLMRWAERLVLGSR